MTLVSDIVHVYRQYPEIKTEVIAASIRHPQHCLAAALAGAHIATIPYNIMLQMARHPMTEAGNARFLEDWRKVMGDVKNI